MERFISPDGITISYDKAGSGPPLVLVHGSFSDHLTNWEFVKPILQQRFTFLAIARRGRGETSATEGHNLEDEGKDVAALIRAVGEPVFLLGHSYGAQCSLAALRFVPDRVRALVLYEPPWPRAVSNAAFARMEDLGAANAWDQLACLFFKELSVPISELEALRDTELWPPIVNDAKASLGDIRALKKQDFNPEHYRHLKVPVLLQVGSESPRDLYVTDALNAVLSDVRIEVLNGQAHEGMTTAPQMYAEAVTKFLLGTH